MRTRIKICGISTPEMARAAVDAGADAIGLMFVEGSPREVSIETAERIVAELPAFVEPVGVFQNQPVDYVRDVAARLHLRTVQLHGRETPEQAAALEPRRIIKALSFNAELEAVLAPWRLCVNFAALMLDAPPPAAARQASDLAGGHGAAFDWHALARLRAQGALTSMPPLMLAGGLNPENVGRAIALVRPYAVDVSSGVEASRGVKDARRIAAFCAAARTADASTDEPAPRPPR